MRFFCLLFLFFVKCIVYQLPVWQKYFIGVDRTFCSVHFQLCFVHGYLYRANENKTKNRASIAFPTDVRYPCIVFVQFFVQLFSVYYKPNFFLGEPDKVEHPHFIASNKMKGFPSIALILVFFVVYFSR